MRHTGRPGTPANQSRRPSGVDFRSELGLLKAALIYADNVRLVSVGASTVATLDELRRMPASAKLGLIRNLSPLMQADATPEKPHNTTAQRA